MKSALAGAKAGGESLGAKVRHEPIQIDPVSGYLFLKA